MPPNKFYRWIKFLDRIKYFYRGELTHETHSQALRELADPNALKRRKIKQMHTTNNYVGTHPDIVKFWRIFHKDMEKRNIPIRAFEFKRSHDRQNELYKEGRSFAKGGMSAHNYGLAVDVISTTKAWSLSKKQWDLFIAIGYEAARKANIKIKNGSEFKNLYDPAHWELLNWKEIASPKIVVLTEKQQENRARYLAVKAQLKK